MANYIYLNQVAHHDIYLIFGCRKLADSLYGSELKELERKIPSFHYIPTYSREEPGDYRTGYVHAAYEDICRSKIRHADPDSPLYPHPPLLFMWMEKHD
jgi:CDP-4-dehydro-6-deoxyglucose reductase